MTLRRRKTEEIGGDLRNEKWCEESLDSKEQCWNIINTFNKVRRKSWLKLIKTPTCTYLTVQKGYMIF